MISGVSMLAVVLADEESLMRKPAVSCAPWTLQEVLRQHCIFDADVRSCVACPTEF
jgi:hypothetical protein